MYSESGGLSRILITPDVPTQESATLETRVDLMSEVSSGQPRVDYFQKNTSDVDDLFDTSGTEMPANQPTFIDLGSESSTNPESIVLPKSGIKEVTMASDKPCPTSFTKQLSASGRTIFRRYFTENNPIFLPIGARCYGIYSATNQQCARSYFGETFIPLFHTLKTIQSQVFQRTIRRVHQRIKQR